jgi:O-antigen/teichoic acid export membrane protein
MDMYVVGGAMSAASLGIYSIATGLADRMTTVMTVVPTGLYRFQATSDNENRRVEKLTLRALRLSFALGLAISLAVVLVSRFAISLLFGKGYAMATIPLGILAVEATIGIGFYIFRGYLTGYRMKPEVSAVFGLVLVGLSTAASLILVRRLGITGAAIASLSGTVLVFLPFALYFRKTTGSSWRDMLLVTREDIGVVIAAARAVARRVFNRPVRSIQPLPNTILQPGSEDYGA